MIVFRIQHLLYGFQNVNPWSGLAAHLPDRLPSLAARLPRGPRRDGGSGGRRCLRHRRLLRHRGAFDGREEALNLLAPVLAEMESETKTKPIHSLQLYRTFFFFSLSLDKKQKVLVTRDIMVTLLMLIL